MPDADLILLGLTPTLELMADAVVVTTASLDPPGPAIRWVNPAFTAMTGYCLAEIIGKSPRLLQGPKTDPALLARLRRDLEADRRFFGETVNYRKDRSEYVVEWQIVPILDSAGQTRYWLSVQRDVTPRRAAAAALEQTAARLDRAERLARLGHWQRDLITGDGYWSEEACRIFGFPPGFFPSTEEFLAQVHPEDREAVAAWRRDAIAGRRPFDMAFRIVRPDGAIRHIRSRGKVTGDPSGRPTLATGTAHDITEQHRVEAALRDSEARFRSLVENMPDILFCRGERGDGPWGYTAAGVSVYGADTRLRAGMATADGRADPASWYSRIHPDDRPAYMAAQRSRMETGQGYSVDYRFIHPATGQQSWARDIGWRVTDPETGQVFLDGAILNISHQKEVEQALADSERRLRALLETSPDCITTLNPAGIILYLNRADPPLYVEDVVGTSVYLYMTAESAKHYREALARAASEGTIQSVEIVNIRHRTMAIRIVPLSSGNHANSVMAIGTDVTERRQAERALRDSERKFRSYVNNALDALFVVDAGGRYRDVNPAASALLGYSREELLNLSILDLVPDKPEARETVLAQFQELKRDGVWRGLIRLRHKDGQLLDVDLNAIEIEPNRYLGIVRDISTRVRLQAELARFRAVVEHSHEAIAIADIDGRISYVNPAHERLFARPLDIARTLGWNDHYPPAVAAELAAKIDPRLRRGETWEGVVEACDTSGRRFPLWQRIDAVRNAKGDAILRFGIMHDYSAEQRLKNQLRLAKEQAEQASAAKTRFLASASHDLRQPLQAGIILHSILTRRNRDGSLDEILGKLGQSLVALQDMLNTLLGVAQIDAGMVAPEPADFPIGPMFDRLASEFLPRTEAEGLEFRMVETSATVHSDPHLLERILRNLLSNAVTYTRTGRILLGCRPSRDAVRLQVWDTGIGIPEDELTTIFEEFYQIGNPARERQKGLGLGLAIVERLARVLDHRITVRSRLGHGSMFEIMVPRARGSCAPNRPEAERKSYDVASGAIAVVENDALILDALTLLLESLGYTVLAADNADAMVDILRRDHIVPDLILADYRLSGGVTGIDAVTRIRSEFGPSIPGILLTGDTSPRLVEEAKFRELGVLHKPIAADDLNRLLVRIRQRPPLPSALSRSPIAFG